MRGRSKADVALKHEKAVSGKKVSPVRNYLVARGSLLGRLEALASVGSGCRPPLMAGYGCPCCSIDIGSCVRGTWAH